MFCLSTLPTYKTLELDFQFWPFKSTWALTTELFTSHHFMGSLRCGCPRNKDPFGIIFDGSTVLTYPLENTTLNQAQTSAEQPNATQLHKLPGNPRGFPPQLGAQEIEVAGRQSGFRAHVTGERFQKHGSGSSVNLSIWAVTKFTTRPVMNVVYWGWQS